MPASPELIKAVDAFIFAARTLDPLVARDALCWVVADMVWENKKLKQEVERLTAELAKEREGKHDEPGK